jgi:hypothetical protein
MSLPKFYVGLPIREAGLELLRVSVDCKIWDKHEKNPERRNGVLETFEG